MNPLFLFCGIGLLGMSVTAAAQPDVTPDLAALPHVTGAASPAAVEHDLPASVPMPSPKRGPTVIERPVEPVREVKFVERFSRMRLPERDTPPAELLVEAIDAGIQADTRLLARAVPPKVTTPLTDAQRRRASFSRRMLPRATYAHRRTNATKQAPASTWIAFEVTRTFDRRLRLQDDDAPERVALGRYHRKTGRIELAAVGAKRAKWTPAAEFVKRFSHR